MRLSYPLWLKFRGELYGLIWQTEDNPETEYDDDCVLVDAGKIVWVRAAEDYQVVCSVYGLILEEGDGEVWNLDDVERLLELPASEEVCSQILNAWNLLGDIACTFSVDLEQRTKILDKCYDKLFYGNNLPGITPEGEDYRPYFSDVERRHVAALFDRGRELVAAHI